MKDQNTAQKILKAAEEEFFEKGFGGARMLSIAARAGVSHSMLHYYFRSKEELFKQVFDSKAKLISAILEGIYSEDVDFLDLIRQFSERQFDVMKDNDRFGMFVVSNVVNDQENLRKAIELCTGRFSAYLKSFTHSLEEEIKAGRIRRISAANLILDVVSLNMMTFLSLPVMRKIMSKDELERYLSERKTSNADLIVAGLRP